MLSRKHISLKEMINIVETGQISADWLIRAYFTFLESNLADKVYPYIQQQTMTLSKTEIICKFGILTKPTTHDGVFRLFLEIDLSRWNLKWRDLPIRLIGEDLNDIFGMRIAFSMGHEFFKNCMIVVRHNQYEPPNLDKRPPVESELLWYDHEGGFEGIAQKTW
ncbi:hypothetical protein Golomagni_05672 [Golovinomyces magnicellulatus]|nr:hypothetical protein Golomagni_05672 [Golovinomyces magnicellulatus]